MDLILQRLIPITPWVILILLIHPTFLIKIVPVVCILLVLSTRQLPVLYLVPMIFRQVLPVLDQFMAAFTVIHWLIIFSPIPVLYLNKQAQVAAVVLLQPAPVMANLTPQLDMATLVAMDNLMRLLDMVGMDTVTQRPVTDNLMHL